MRTLRQFRPFVDRLPYRITPGDISNIQAIVPAPSDGGDDGGDGGDDGSGSIANPSTPCQPAPPQSTTSTS
jgi:hypothetical protein